MNKIKGKNCTNFYHIVY